FDLGKAQVPPLMNLRIPGLFPEFIHAGANRNFDVNAGHLCCSKDKVWPTVLIATTVIRQPNLYSDLDFVAQRTGVNSRCSETGEEYAYPSSTGQKFWIPRDCRTTCQRTRIRAAGTAQSYN